MGGQASSEVSWIANADSISTPGEKCILSSVIEGMTPEELWAIIAKYLHESGGQKDNPTIKKRDFEDLKDGGKHETVYIEVDGVAGIVAGNINMTIHTVYYLDEKNLRATTKIYGADETLTKPSMVSQITLIREPEFRIEFMTESFSVRSGDDILRNGLRRTMDWLGYDKVELTANAESPSMAGERCVLSGELPEQDLTPEAFWEKLKAAYSEHMNTAPLPDDTMVVEEAPILVGNASYHRHFVDKDDKSLIIDEIYYTEELEEVEITICTKLLDKPKRIEAWSTSRAAKRTTEADAEGAKGWLQGVLKMNEEDNKK